MVFILQDNISRKYGYKIVDRSEGIQRIIDEVYQFNAPGEVLGYLTILNEALSKDAFKVSKDQSTNSYGYIVYDPKTNRELCSESGWENPDLVHEHLKAFKASVIEGIKMYEPPRNIKMKLGD